MNTQAFPLDFSALNKGDLVPQEKIEQIFRVRAQVDAQAYQLSALRLVTMIENHRQDLVAVVDGRDVRVLLDSEADGVLHRRAVNAVRSIHRNTKRRGRLDHAQLTAEQRKTAESRDQFATALTIQTRKLLQKAERDKLLAAVTSNALEEADDE